MGPTPISLDQLDSDIALAALALGVVHLLIDTRKPLEVWSRVIGQTTEGPVAVPLHIWRDQVLHVTTIAVAALIVSA